MNLKSNKLESLISLNSDTKKKTRLGNALRDNLKKRKLQANTRKIEKKVCDSSHLVKK